jgi:Icc-related predicted phosphoesterase
VLFFRGTGFADCRAAAMTLRRQGIFFLPVEDLPGEEAGRALEQLLRRALHGRRSATKEQAVIRIAAVGDIHIDERRAGRLRPQWKRLHEDADILLLAGDLTHLGTAAEVRVLVEEMRDLPVPAVAVLGNHDHHAEDAPAIRRALESIGITVLDGETFTLRVGAETLGVAGVKGFCGGFPGACGHKFGEREMKAFVQTAEDDACRLEAGLRSLDADWRVALMHYAPVRDTLSGEPLELYPYLGSYQLEVAVDRAGADLAIHGHAHYGAPEGLTSRGVPVRNVALPLIRRPYALFTLT